MSAEDLRTKREKLLDMARQTASPREAEVARAILASQGVSLPDRPSSSGGHRTLSRDDIMATPDVRAPRSSYRAYVASVGAYVTLDDDFARVGALFGFSEAEMRDVMGFYEKEDEL